MCTVLLPPGVKPFAVKYIIRVYQMYYENALLHKLCNTHVTEDRGKKSVLYHLQI
jgi:hypothetical protein